MALEHLMNNQRLIPNLRNIIVYSDSLSSLELLYFASQHKIDINTLNCLCIIETLASRGQIQYVPSHLAITGNHQADDIAKPVLNIDQPSGRPIPIRDIYCWRLSELTLNKNKPCLYLFPNKNLSKIYYRIWSGSNGQNSQAFLHQFPNSSGSIPSSLLCRHCSIINETIEHCLFECSILISAKYTLQCKLLKCFKHNKILLSAKSLADHTCTQSTELNVYPLILKLLESNDLLQYF
jgi:hypothetical protein